MEAPCLSSHLLTGCPCSRGTVDAAETLVLFQLPPFSLLQSCLLSAFCSLFQPDPVDHHSARWTQNNRMLCCRIWTVTQPVGPQSFVVEGTKPSCSLRRNPAPQSTKTFQRALQLDAAVSSVGSTVLHSRKLVFPCLISSPRGNKPYPE